MKEYYRILGLNEGSSKEEIKKAYRKLSKKYHPDLNPNNKEVEDKFKKVSEAYSILTGKEKPKANPFNNEPFNPHDFGGFRNHRKGKPRPLKLIIDLTLEECYFGVIKTIKYNKYDACDSCNGLGGHNTHTCNQCNGKGMIQHGPFVFMCNNCNGSGNLFKDKCNKCNGSGKNYVLKKVEINVPKGTTPDTAFNYPNIGDYNSGQNGDVIFIIKLKNHSIYELDGLNLKRNIDIPLLDILLGTEKEFNTLDSKIKIKIPKLSKMDKTFRLKEKGFRDGATNIIGDLLVTLNPVLPKELNSEEIKQLNKLKNLQNFNI